MALDVTPTLRKAVQQLQAERNRLDHQISSIQSVLGGQNTAPKARRRRMSPAARRAVGRRMKAYWAKRRAEKMKGDARVAKYPNKKSRRSARKASAKSPAKSRGTSKQAKTSAPKAVAKSE